MNIEHKQNEKFFFHVPGGEAHLMYEKAGNALDIFEVMVPVESRGKNIAESLVKEALKFAKENNMQIIPTCPYVKKWFERHPEESSILKH